MSHFPASDWIHLFEGVLPKSKQGSIRSHIELGCEECRDNSEIWRLILDKEIEASEKGAAGGGELQWLEPLEPARLVYDSVRDSPAASTRSLIQTHRQVVHEAEPFIIDLKIETKSTRASIFLVGQVLNSRAPDIAVQGIEVTLVGEDRLLKKTRANSLGEFDFDYDPEPNLHLLINIRGYRAIALALPEFEV